MFFAAPGAVLDVEGAALDEALIGAWRARVGHAAAHLGWPPPATVARAHRRGTSLALTAPPDQLLLATEVNEWALCAALLEHQPERWSHLEEALVAAASAEPPPVIEASAALARFAALAAREANPRLRPLLEAAAARRLPQILDESLLTLGAGAGAQPFPLTALPAVGEVAWQTLHDIPTVLVTGSNGKTTTVRLLAACARAHGWHTGFNCTDGVYVDTEPQASGDYSGPAGARSVLRDPRVEAAILETARGGILRRGLAVSQAHAAVITNVSPDHFGEYGIDDLEGVAQVKFVVAAVVAPDGLLVLNADDPHLRRQADGLARRFGRCPPLGWFSLDPDPSVLRAERARGEPLCTVHSGHLRLRLRGIEHDLGTIAGMPLSMGGSAAYNVANMAGAALAAAALGIAPPTIAGVLARFGARLEDNPGRMMRFDLRGATVLIDYAHNVDGLRGFLGVARRLRGASGRLGMLLGQAGNRTDADIEDLAHVVSEFAPDLVVIKENDTQLRGRAPGEVPRILRTALERLGMPPAALPLAGNEVEAARHALDWARAGDVLALPVHSAGARAAVIDMLRTRGT